MRDYVIKPAMATVLAVVLAALTVSDIALSVVTLKQHSRISQLSPRPATGVAEGSFVPMISGKKIVSNEDWRVLPSGTRTLVLLVFRETCHFCEQNWANWESLFGKRGPRALLVTEDPKVSDSYRASHPLLLSQLGLSAVDRSSVGSINLNITPQTILVRDGKVEHDWVGVLSKEQVAQIQQKLAEAR